jgi:predicted TIM-barrel fold metal-dependent hydrolase
VISTEADDDCVGMVVEWMGPEYVMWASDFPHPDAIFPGAVDTFLHECEEHSMSEDDVRVILWDGPMAFYGLEDRFTSFSRQ